MRFLRSFMTAAVLLPLDAHLLYAPETRGPAQASTTPPLTEPPVWRKRSVAENACGWINGDLSIPLESHKHKGLLLTRKSKRVLLFRIRCDVCLQPALVGRGLQGQ